FILNIPLSLGVLSFAQVGSFNISGQITCQRNDGLEGVNVALLNQNGQLIDSLSTDQNGNYVFTNVPIGAVGETYQVEAFYEGQPLNGVSTFDMVMVTRHILGVESLDPAEIVAADLNRSGTLTTFDLVQMRAWILFLPLTATLTPPGWLLYREVNGQIQEGPFSVPSDNGNQVLNISAIKRGDVNGSAICR
ncbi:MAG: carboxypeptidase regulatory-like domain-containing protein, partial [Bacteroidota bacterium]